MKHRKFICSLFTCGFIFSLSSCGETTKEEDKTSSPTSHITTVVAPTTSVQQTYIKDIKAVGAYWDKYAYNGASVLKDKYSQEYSRLSNCNLNRDCGTTTDCIYLYESRTIHAEEAITDIIAVTQRNTPKNFVYNNRNYEVVGGIRVNGLNSSKTEYECFDLNMGAGGDYIYLCVSRDQSLKPITKFTVGGISDFSDDKSNNFIMNSTNTDEYQNFNAGAGGSAVYAAYSILITGWTINKVDMMDRNIDGEYVTNTITLDTEKKTLSEEQLKPFIDKGTGSYFEGYYSKKVIEEGEQITTSTKFPYDYTIWAKWSYDISIDFTAVGGDIKTYSKISKFTHLNEYGMYYLVFEKTGKKASGGPHWPGTYIAIAY